MSSSATNRPCICRTIVDGRGVAEPVQETTCDCHDCDCPPIRKGLTIRGTHSLGLQPSARADTARRTLQQEVNDPPLMVFATGLPVPSSGALRLWGAPGTSSGTLPANVQLLTLMERQEQRGVYLVRLAHLYEAREAKGTGLGDAVCVDVSAVLGAEIADLRELTLTGVSNAMEARRQRRTKAPWSTTEPLSRLTELEEPQCLSQGAGAKVVGLRPMEIKTFEVVLATGGATGTSSGNTRFTRTAPSSAPAPITTHR